MNIKSKIRKLFGRPEPVPLEVQIKAEVEQQVGVLRNNMVVMLSNHVRVVEDRLETKQVLRDRQMQGMIVKQEDALNRKQVDDQKHNQEDIKSQIDKQVKRQVAKIKPVGKVIYNPENTKNSITTLPSEFDECVECTFLSANDEFEEGDCRRILQAKCPKTTDGVKSKPLECEWSNGR